MKNFQIKENDLSTYNPVVSLAIVDKDLGTVFYETTVGDQKLIQALEWFSAVEDVPLEAQDINLVLDNTKQSVFYTTSQFVALSLLIGFYDMSFKDLCNLTDMVRDSLSKDRNFVFNYIVYHC